MMKGWDDGNWDKTATGEPLIVEDVLCIKDSQLLTRHVSEGLHNNGLLLSL